MMLLTTKQRQWKCLEDKYRRQTKELTNRRLQLESELSVIGNSNPKTANMLRQQLVKLKEALMAAQAKKHEMSLKLAASEKASQAGVTSPLVGMVPLTERGRQR